MEREAAATGVPQGGALEGIRVIDLTMMLAGPYASMMLADQGADVIKIEPPGGDKTRQIGPHLSGAKGHEHGGFGGYFASINRNKRSVVLDLKSEPGLAALKRMLSDSDILIENFRYGVMERLGLDGGTLQALNPRLVHVSIRGFGDKAGGVSPYRDWPAYDPVSQAMGGIMGITGPVPGGIPTKIGPGIGDIAPAMFAAFGALAATFRAHRTGRGERVDISMVDSVLALCERIVFQYSATARAPGPEGNGHPLLCPFGLFEASDGFITLAIPNDKFWGVFVALIGKPELAIDKQFATNSARLENATRTVEIVSDWTSKRSRAEITEAIGGKVPFAPVMTAADIFADPHFSSRNMIVETAFPGTKRNLHIANSPVVIENLACGVRTRAPMTGEHTAEVLREFGFDADAVSALAVQFGTSRPDSR
ncbi:MAG: CoA transferase [Pararhodobacter sp.]|nr:CoA transferase [Pararhodobacter sp.]